MRTSERRVKLAWAGLIFASLFALLCLVLLATGTTGPDAWFAVASMAVLAATQANILIRERRQRLRD